MSRNLTEASVRDYLDWVVRSRRAFHPERPDDFVYCGIEDLVLRHGRSFTPQPLPAQYKRMLPKFCFDNAYRLCRRRKGLRYVEGFATGIITMHHAWAVDERDAVVDPTWERPGTEYFGVVVPLERVKSIRKRERCSVFEDWSNDWRVLREPWEGE